VALPIIALGASAIVMIATGSWMATILGFAPLAFGNVLLHQILQQFNSSTMGTVIATVVIALAVWTVRSERSEREIVAGHALVGWACGTLAITSMEAHPFYLIAFGLVALLPIVRDRQLKRSVGCVGAFICGYLAASFRVRLIMYPGRIMLWRVCARAT
jgi:amino acid transporter